MRGRRIKGGAAQGKALVCSTPLSFLGGVDASSGKILDRDCGARGRTVRNSILCFPYGRGSTVGSYAMYQLKLNGKAPAAIINRSAEPIVATGAIISGIPMVDEIDTSVIANGDDVVVDASSGTVELKGVKERHVVTCVLRHGTKVLLLRRSNEVGSYQGHWAGVSGFIEEGETDIEAARREIAEEVGLKTMTPRKHVGSESFRNSDTVWTVHPFLFDVKTARISTDWEHDEHRWVDPSEICQYDTVPGLETVVMKLLDGA
jgi:predicted aconitase with swiveling domain/8-oxo-dGTP pyrophosphatase MutT (NUDIX family)